LGRLTGWRQANGFIVGRFDGLWLSRSFFCSSLWGLNGGWPPKSWVICAEEMLGTPFKQAVKYLPTPLMLGSFRSARCLRCHQVSCRKMTAWNAESKRQTPTQRRPGSDGSDGSDPWGEIWEALSEFTSYKHLPWISGTSWGEAAQCYLQLDDVPRSHSNAQFQMLEMPVLPVSPFSSNRCCSWDARKWTSRSSLSEKGRRRSGCAAFALWGWDGVHGSLGY